MPRNSLREHAGAMGNQNLTWGMQLNGGIFPHGFDLSFWNTFAGESWAIPGLTGNRK
jgi:hypothetical protein